MSTLKADTIQSTSGGAATLTKQSATKAWGEFNGSAGTISYGDSFNCASLTDNGTSDYSSARTNNMGNALYPVLGTAGKTTTGERNFNVPDGQFANTTSTFRMQITTSDGVLASDQATFISFGLNGDLA
jgi:hypothetical protein